MPGTYTMVQVIPARAFYTLPTLLYPVQWETGHEPERSILLHRIQTGLGLRGLPELEGTSLHVAMAFQTGYKPMLYTTVVRGNLKPPPQVRPDTVWRQDLAGKLLKLLFTGACCFIME